MANQRYFAVISPSFFAKLIGTLRIKGTGNQMRIPERDRVFIDLLSVRITENVEERMTKSDLQWISQFNRGCRRQCSQNARDRCANIRTQRERVDTFDRDDTQTHQRRQRGRKDRTALHQYRKDTANLDESFDVEKSLVVIVRRVTPMAKYGVRCRKTPGKSAFTVLKITVLIVPLSIDWRSFTRRIRQQQRANNERTNRRRPTPQSGQDTFEKMNPHRLSGINVELPYSLVTFWKEQKRFKSEALGSSMPIAMFWMTFSSSWKTGDECFVRHPWWWFSHLNNSMG